MCLSNSGPFLGNPDFTHPATLTQFNDNKSPKKFQASFHPPPTKTPSLSGKRPMPCLTIIYNEMQPWIKENKNLICIFCLKNLSKQKEFAAAAPVSASRNLKKVRDSPQKEVESKVVETFYENQKCRNV